MRASLMPSSYSDEVWCGIYTIQKCNTFTVNRNKSKTTQFGKRPDLCDVWTTYNWDLNFMPLKLRVNIDCT